MSEIMIVSRDHMETDHIFSLTASKPFSRQIGSEENMATPSILLQTKQNGLFASDRGYSDVSDRDLLALVELCRKTTESMEAELVKRQIWINSKVSTVVDESLSHFCLWDTLAETVEATKHLERRLFVLLPN
ncbi:hypothetical protein ETB97_009037 [Aspergillus alliaceus]|uniref:Uncharacterized protein n=1 Tax=Petromyces alliaceus TaxID=209559 RepID=A0A8H6ACU2_PETAA|nr:hypothetical protein ETB97_009037 [Aspergillus burnettii]